MTIEQMKKRRDQIARRFKHADDAEFERLDRLISQAELDEADRNYKAACDEHERKNFDPISRLRIDPEASEFWL